jgi:hypothetical protein
MRRAEEQLVAFDLEREKYLYTRASDPGGLRREVTTGTESL